MTALRVLLLAVLLAGATMFLGWWSVPAIAALYALALRDVSAPRDAALAALVAWSVLLARLSLLPDMARLLTVLGGIFPLPGIALMFVSVLFAVGLAWSAARLVVGLGANRKSIAARVNEH